MHVKALVHTVAGTLVKTKAVILAIITGNMLVQVLVERLAVTLTKAECLVETLSDAHECRITPLLACQPVILPASGPVCRPLFRQVSETNLLLA